MGKDYNSETLKTKIGFLGPKGTFTEEALDVWTKKQRISPDSFEKIAFSSISDVINAVGKMTQMAIVPVENSIAGSVNMTIDTLFSSSDIKIKGEVVLSVAQHLFAKEKIPFGKITKVYSHPQGLFQCRKFLRENLPDAKLIELPSTAEAGRLVSLSDEKIAAIGNRTLSSIYGIITLAQNVQDHKNNMTRFYLLSGEDEKATGRDKTTIIFSVENRPGSLYGCLKIFADKKLNLTKMESRPSSRNLGEYVFYIEIEGHRSQEPLKTALNQLESSVSFCRTIGSYPIYDLPETVI